MEVLFFTEFSKRKNSTKVPNDELAVVKNVRLKSTTDKMNPTFLLNGTEDYVYCKAWSMYYFVHRIGYDIDGAQMIYCNLDVLATFKEQILNTSAYIIYSSTGYDRWIKDDRCPIIIKDSEYLRTSSAIVFDEDAVFTASDNESVVITTVSESFGIFSWVLSEDDLRDVMYELFINQTNLDAILDQFGDVNNAIVSVIRLPITRSLLEDTNDTPISFGTVSNGTTNEYHWLGRKHLRAKGSIGMPLTYTDYRFTEPYCKAKITLPFIGTFDISLSELAPEGGCNWMLDIDILTGTCIYTLYQGDNVNIPTKIIGTYSGTCGGNVPIANIQQQNPYGVTKGAITGLLTSGLAMAGGHIAGGVVGGIASIVGGFFEYGRDTATVIGAYSGGRSEYASRSIELCVEKFKTANEPSNLTDFEGRPVCKVDTIGNYSGYVRTHNFSIDISTLDVIKDMINNYLNSGIYIE